MLLFFQLTLFVSNLLIATHEGISLYQYCYSIKKCNYHNTVQIIDMFERLLIFVSKVGSPRPQCIFLLRFLLAGRLCQTTLRKIKT